MSAAHIVRLVRGARVDANGDELPGEQWLIDGTVWFRWTFELAKIDFYSHEPMTEADAVRRTAPFGWYRDEDWAGQSWGSSAAKFNPLMSAVIQAIWEEFSGER